jgi:hypothetical protein
MRWVIGDAGEHVGEPSLWIDIIHFCGDDEAYPMRAPHSFG